jgi:cytochrome oxidase assembly protein ShyY1
VRVLLRPRWLLSHVLVLLLVLAMIGAALWQLARLDERRESNATIEARQELPTEDLDALLATADDPGDDLQYRHATAVGTFDPSGEVLVANRTLEGAPGFWVLTPLVTAPGEAVLVNRGFVGRAIALEGGAADYAPPAGEVTVVGVVQPSRSGGVLVEAEGVRQISRPDVEAIDEVVDETLAPVLLQLETAEPPMLAVRPPDLGEGPHLSYAVQWVVFTLIALIGYPLVLRRVVRGRAASGDVAVDTDVDEPAR